jgi:hypothetical protein
MPQLFNVKIGDTYHFVTREVMLREKAKAEAEKTSVADSSEPESNATVDDEVTIPSEEDIKVEEKKTIFGKKSKQEKEL